MSVVVPIDQLERRLPTAGRIRIGHKTSSGRPDKLASFRFTGQDKASIEQVAALYGGEVNPWKGHAGQWEVYTPSTEIRVVLPPDPLGGTPIYELWSGGGCLRRCTGRVVQLRTSGPDGGQLVEQDCLCAQRGVLECTRKTRLSVILPEVRFLGVWRIDTGSKIASEQLPGMVDTFEHLREHQGLPYALLRLERVSVPAPTKRGWTQGTAFIPTLGFDQSPEGLMAGPPIAQLNPGPATPPRGELVYPDRWEDKPPPPITSEQRAISAYHPDPELVAAWKGALSSAQKAKLLAKVREEWIGLAVPPATFDEIPLEIIDSLMEKGITVDVWPGNV